MKYRLTVFLGCLVAGSAGAEPARHDLGDAFAAIQPKVIEWRRDFHQHPELSNRETRTAKVVADHLKKLGLEVKTGIAHHGVTGVLRGAKPGPTIAIRPGSKP